MSNFEPIPLPENYQGSFNLESMLPGDTAFIYPHSLKQEANNGGLYLDKGTEITDDFTNPSYLSADRPSDRVGIIKVYSEIGGEPLDGFVVDISDIKPGSVKREKLFPVIGEDSTFDSAYLVSQQSKWSQVLGLRYRDAEGEIKYAGPEWLQDAAVYVGEVLDAKKIKAKTMPREGVMPGVELLDIIETKDDSGTVIVALSVNSESIEVAGTESNINQITSEADKE